MGSATGLFDSAVAIMFVMAASATFFDFAAGAAVFLSSGLAAAACFEDVLVCLGAFCSVASAGALAGAAAVVFFFVAAALAVPDAFFYPGIF